MSRFEVKVSGDWKSAFKAFEIKVFKGYKLQLDRMLVKLNTNLLSKTPVWEGDTIRNWRWAIGRPDLSAPKEAAGAGTPPGPTNSMPLGSEPLRPANEALQKDDFNTFRAELAGTTRPLDIYLTNTTDSALPLEFGLLPTPALSRTKGKGMLLLAVVETLTAMGAR